MFAQNRYMLPCYLADILDMKLWRHTYKSSPACRRNKFCDKQYSPVLCLSERPSIDTNNASSPTRCFYFVIHNTLLGIIHSLTYSSCRETIGFTLQWLQINIERGSTSLQLFTKIQRSNTIQ